MHVNPHPQYWLKCKREINSKQDCIPVGCIPPACWPYLPACTAQGGAWSQGVSALGGCLLQGECLLWGGVCSRGVPAPGWGLPLGGCLLLGGGVCAQVVPGPGGVGWGGIPACTEVDPPCEQNSWHTLLKILPCPKLRLRAVINLQLLLELRWPFLV